jgi:hypothetical protein
LTWAQSAASIVYAYLRLDQRALPRLPDGAQRLRTGAASLALTSCNLAAVLGLSFAGVTPRWLFAAYAVQWLETLWGTSRPAVGLKPRAIGYRQAAFSTLFTLLFIVAWRLG